MWTHRHFFCLRIIMATQSYPYFEVEIFFSSMRQEAHRNYKYYILGESNKLLKLMNLPYQDKCVLM